MTGRHLGSRTRDMKPRVRVDPGPGYDQHGMVVFMAAARGYVMARRPHCMPFVLPLKEWLAMPREPLNARFGAASRTRLKDQEQ